MHICTIFPGDVITFPCCCCSQRRWDRMLLYLPIVLLVLLVVLSQAPQLPEQSIQQHHVVLEDLPTRVLGATGAAASSSLLPQGTEEVQLAIENLALSAAPGAAPVRKPSEAHGLFIVAATRASPFTLPYKQAIKILRRMDERSTGFAVVLSNEEVAGDSLRKAINALVLKMEPVTITDTAGAALADSGMQPRVFSIATPPSSEDVVEKSVTNINIKGNTSCDSGSCVFMSNETEVKTQMPSGGLVLSKWRSSSMNSGTVLHCSPLMYKESNVSTGETRLHHSVSISSVSLSGSNSSSTRGRSSIGSSTKGSITYNSTTSTNNNDINHSYHLRSTNNNTTNRGIMNTSTTKSNNINNSSTESRPTYISSANCSGVNSCSSSTTGFKGRDNNLRDLQRLLKRIPFAQGILQRREFASKSAEDAENNRERRSGLYMARWRTETATAALAADVALQPEKKKQPLHSMSGSFLSEQISTGETSAVQLVERGAAEPPEIAAFSAHRTLKASLHLPPTPSVIITANNKHSRHNFGTVSLGVPIASAAEIYSKKTKRKTMGICGFPVIIGAAAASSLNGVGAAMKPAVSESNSQRRVPSAVVPDQNKERAAAFAAKNAGGTGTSMALPPANSASVTASSQMSPSSISQSPHRSPFTSAARPPAHSAFPSNSSSSTTTTSTTPHQSTPSSMRSSSSFVPVAPTSTSSKQRTPPVDSSGIFASWDWVLWRHIWLISMSVSLVLLAGVASGLTTGLMAFDELQLLVVQQTGAAPEKQQAEAVCDLIHRNRHQLLVTLLLCNALAMEALPLFLDRLVSPVLAVLLSVTAILFVGEILPQALCTGRYQLAIAAHLAPFVRLLLVVFWPAAYPISRLLDYWLSDREKPSLYARAHLKALIGLHQRDRQLPLLLQHRIEARRAQAAAEHRRSPGKKRTRKTEEDKTREGGGEQEFISINSIQAARDNNTTAKATFSGVASQSVPAAMDISTNSATSGATATAGVGATASIVKEADKQTPASSTKEKKSSSPTSTQQTVPSTPFVERHRDEEDEEQGVSSSRNYGSFGEESASAARNRAVPPTNYTQETAYSGSCLEGSTEDMENAVGLRRDEVLIMQGALDMACKSACDLMVPLEDVYMLDQSVRLTREVLIDILAKGHSRIPVYEGRRENVRGVLLVKSLVLIDPGAGVRIADLMRGRSFRRLCTPLFVAPTSNPYKLLNEFQELLELLRIALSMQYVQEGQCHLAFVTRDVAAYQQAWEDNTSVRVGTQLLGIVTLEDVIEELIQEEIMDEFDRRFRTGGASSSFRGVEEAHLNANFGLRPTSVFSSSEAARAQRQSEEMYNLYQRPTKEALSFGEDVKGRRKEVRVPAAFTEDSAPALSRFASLLLTRSQDEPLRGDACEALDHGRTATSILASSQLGSRASLLFASAPDIEGDGALDSVTCGDRNARSPRCRYAARKILQEHEEKRRVGRWNTAYFPLSKQFAATYRPGLQLQNSSTGPSALADKPCSSTDMSSRLFGRLHSASPPSAVRGRSCQSASPTRGNDNGAVNGALRGTTYGGGAVPAGAARACVPTTAKNSHSSSLLRDAQRP